MTDARRDARLDRDQDATLALMDDSALAVLLDKLHDAHAEVLDRTLRGALRSAARRLSRGKRPGAREMGYELPDDETLRKYMYMLTRVLREARNRAYGSDPQIAELLDAVENVPDLLLRWGDMKQSIVFEDLRRIEGKYTVWKGRFTTPLREGEPANWQLKGNKREP